MTLLKMEYNHIIHSPEKAETNKSNNILKSLNIHNFGSILLNPKESPKKKKIFKQKLILINNQRYNMKMGSLIA